LTTASDINPGAVSETSRRAVSPALSLLANNALLICVLGVCMSLQAALVRGAIQADTWYTLLGGRVVAQAGIPHRDGLTWLTLGRRWVDQQWLSQFELYRLWSVGGWQAAMLGGIAFYGCAFAVVAALARRGGASELSVGLVLLLSFLTGLPNTQLRAQVPAYLLFALVLVLLLNDERSPSARVYLTLPLLVVWANVHGSVLLGALLVTLRGVTMILGRRSTTCATNPGSGTGLLRSRPTTRATNPGSGTGLLRSWILVVAPWLCVLVSPYGLALPGYYRRVLDNPALAHAASEWAQSTPGGQPLFFVLLLVAVMLVSAGWRRRRPAPFALIALAGTAGLGLMAIRNDVWFALVAVAVLPSSLDAVRGQKGVRRKRRLDLPLAFAGPGVAALFALTVAAHNGSWFEHSFPRQAAAAVAAAARADPRARVFADERYSDWLIFEEPALEGRIVYDIRYELLTGAELDRIVDFRVEKGPDWQRAALAYPLLVLDPAGDAGAVRWFEHRRGTAVLYKSSSVVVLRREPA
jgi:hypothetical protein